MLKQIVTELEKRKGAKFLSFTYTSKKHGETARYLLRMGVDYKAVCERDILELELRLKEVSGIEAIVIQKQIDSLRESINARNEGREHIDYTKKGLYRSICPGVKLSLNDGTLEVCGFQHAKKVLIPGDYKKVNHRSEETRLKAEIRKSLSIGKFKTLCLDKDNAHSVRINGKQIRQIA